jgi:RNA polymerase sigma-70 factor (ECF subfamily)
MSARRTPQSLQPAAIPANQDADTWLDDHGDVLYRYARSRVGKTDLAEDLVQETFVSALQSRGRFAGRSTVRTWLLSILRRKIVDHYRRLEESPASRFDSCDRAGRIRLRFFSARGVWRKMLGSWKSPDKALEDREFWQVLDDCLSRLPQHFSAVFVLREFEGLEVKELLRTLAVSESNLRVRLHRARLLLRECLERHWFGETQKVHRSST